ncbi:hypothetical protein DID77_00570 [Candidatus Marinamargulisbacteria bacterium SCGC AG-439-L15]|nr:hypothetical protein DID77_00570 [Candidatus Marinamargulisbacteria bacterium SCGC AG-439-L15]
MQGLTIQPTSTPFNPVLTDSTLQAIQGILNATGEKPFQKLKATDTHTLSSEKIGDNVTLTVSIEGIKTTTETLSLELNNRTHIITMKNRSKTKKIALAAESDLFETVQKIAEKTDSGAELSDPSESTEASTTAAPKLTLTELGAKNSVLYGYFKRQIQPLGPLHGAFKEFVKKHNLDIKTRC